ncbi:MAG: type II 3-dehydroquinate dehydratase [Candidatus Eisenbacteria bacterium]|nr:type II 3-dehydroquinate dehydratase [Candidatus Eisenbacteria bacterium]
MTRILVLLGPNLNLLGRREPGVYGRRTLAQMMERLEGSARELGYSVEVLQSNHEGVLIDRLHEAQGTYAGVLFNPGGLAHTSVALRDAVAACGVDVILVHLSNVWAREAFRHTELVGAACRGGVVGLGEHGFLAGLWALHQMRRDASQKRSATSQ